MKSYEELKRMASNITSECGENYYCSDCDYCGVCSRVCTDRSFISLDENEKINRLSRL